MDAILKFIKTYYKGEVAGADPAESGIDPMIDTIQGRMVVADKKTFKVLAEFTPNGFLYFADGPLMESLRCDFDGLRKGDHEALENSRWMNWVAHGGTHPPLRKQCGPWRKMGEEWVREDYRGEICAEVRLRERAREVWTWFCESISSSDMPKSDSGFQGDPPPHQRGQALQDTDAFYDADVWLKSQGWEFIEDGSWIPKGIFFHPEP